MARNPSQARTIRQAAWANFRLIVAFVGGKILEGNANGESRVIYPLKWRRRPSGVPSMFSRGSFTVSLMALTFYAASADWARADEHAAGFCPKFPFIDTSYCLPESYRPLVLSLAVFLLLIYYVPRGLISIRDSLAQVASTRAMVELEKMKYEILKLRYEIEGLRKQHDIEEISPPVELEDKIRKVKRKAEFISSRLEPSAIDAYIKQQLQPSKKAESYIIRRMFAFIFDYFVIGFASGVVAALVNAVFDADLFGDPSYDLLSTAIIVIVAFAYFAGMPAAIGATLGKKLLGLRIVSSNGEPITPWQALVRFILWLLSNSLLGLGFFWALFGSRKLSLYDRVSNTRVVRVRKRSFD